MSSDLYAFSPGTIIKWKPQSVTIQLEDSNALVKTSWEESARDFITQASSGRKVFCSWQKLSEREGPPSEISHCSVEFANRWRRRLRYKPLFGHSPRTNRGTRAEFWFAGMLREAGIRADNATPFENEKLGIDLWVFLPLEVNWRWYPIDVTLLPLDCQPSSSTMTKYEIAKLHRVLPIQVFEENRETVPHEVAAYTVSAIRKRLTEFNGTKLMSRSAAKTLEITRVRYPAKSVTSAR